MIVSTHEDIKYFLELVQKSLKNINLSDDFLEDKNVFEKQKVFQ